MYRRWFFASLLGLAAMAAAATAWWPGGDARRLNVILLTVESTRADMVRPDTAPNLLRAAESGLHFRNHRAVSAWTAPNAVSLLTGLDAFALGIHAAGDSLPRIALPPVDGKAAEDPPLRKLSERGWRVAGLQAFMLIDQFNNTGLTVESGGEFLPWLAGRVVDRKPFFLWHHYLETHLPYGPAPEFMPDWRALLPPGDTAARQRIETIMRQPAVPAGSVAFKPTDRDAVVAVHEATLRQFDAWFGRFWDFFQASGLRDTTILVVTADHGEEHLERGDVGHASTTHRGHLYEEIVRLPLFVWLPPDEKRLERGLRSIQAPTHHSDVMPSIMAWLEQRRSAPLTRLAEKPWQAITSLAGFAEPDPLHVREFVAARLEAGWKLHRRYRDEKPVENRLYHLATDPGETTDRAAERPDLVEKLAKPLDAAFANRRQVRREAEAAALSGNAAAPAWIFPAGNRAVRFADIRDGITLRWSGDPAARYVIEYQAGEGGALRLQGRLEAQGLEKAFGRIDATYWRDYVLPYGRLRMRVGLPGRDDAWSEWVEVRALP
ncbi:sulfatase-like hydrolase/transferase [Ferrovibrio sp.]|uniref:sulfatase-like hydrolase/transferase n=1 Tax=Ferrovibrio sp. TaxID=1917215 RepID=UPI0025C2D6CA|nr:sulfatase-like hydrolase/transferase [Ferrovibrio sp.]MBX3453311.1 sulfatase-like hydrolase/transferase [Ferrovibrio sp.]